MAKIIRKWSKRRNKTLARAVKNFNAKLKRQIAKGVDKALLPGKMLVSELKQIINTEGDYRKILNSLKSWTKRGSEKVVETKGGAKVTKWALQEAKKHKAEINERREKINKEFEERPIYIDGEQWENVERTVAEQEVKPLTKEIENLNQKDFESFSKWLWRERLDEREINKGIWFIQDISEVFYAQFSAENANYAMRLIEMIGGEKAYSLYHDDGVSALDPKWQYSEPVEEQEKIEKLEEEIFKFLTEEQKKKLAEEFEQAKQFIMNTPPNQRMKKGKMK